MSSNSNCKVIEDRHVPGEWRIETINESGCFVTVQIFRGIDANLRAMDYARERFGEFEETRLPVQAAPYEHN